MECSQKYKRIRQDDHQVRKVLYLLIVKSGFDFILLGFELFPELASIEIEDLDKLDFLNSPRPKGRQTPSINSKINNIISYLELMTQLIKHCKHPL